MPYLALGISGCGILVHLEKEAYETRPIPITYSDVERLHFGRIEELYRRVGTLTNLEHLALHIVALTVIDDDEAEEGEREGGGEVIVVADPHPGKEVQHSTQLAAMGTEMGLSDF
ncbi:MAG: hypothetical protein J3R72DRAFT_419803 [Linnemannia gamsii]|nr:MAG: hypothetical protein J3R72DRAFT_419803 [Linnemannia gamsii]